MNTDKPRPWSAELERDSWDGMDEYRVEWVKKSDLVSEWNQASILSIAIEGFLMHLICEDMVT